MSPILDLLKNSNNIYFIWAFESLNVRQSLNLDNKYIEGHIAQMENKI